MSKKNIRGGPERGKRKQTSLRPLHMEEALRGLLGVDPQRIKEKEKRARRERRKRQRRERQSEAGD